MRRALSILGLTTSLVVLAQPALAIGWGPESTYYHGIKRATGLGDFFNEGNVRAVNQITVTDDARDHNRVYGVTEFLFHQRSCSWDLSQDSGKDCSDDFHSMGTRTTPEFENETKAFKHAMNLTATASRVRAKTFACVQMGWPVPDGCAPAAYPTFDY
jgi:hypothetical protein